MRKSFLVLAIAATMFSCNKVKNAMSNVTNSVSAATVTKSIDYQTLSKPDQSKEWFDQIVEKIGNNAKVTDEIRLWVNRPSMEGLIQHKDASDELTINVVYQDPEDKRRVEEVDYFNEGGWRAPVKKDIQVTGANADKFKLEDELFDFSRVTYDIFKKVIDDAFTKYKDNEKYEYQYVSDVKISKEGFDVTVKGKLKSNAQMKKNYYEASLKGNKR